MLQNAGTGDVNNKYDGALLSVWQYVDSTRSYSMTTQVKRELCRLVPGRVMCATDVCKLHRTNPSVWLVFFVGGKIDMVVSLKI